MTGMPFDPLAKHYARARPGYPAALLAAIAAPIAARSAAGSIVLDVGAGTGISSRALAEVLDASVHIIGVEPSEGMRRQAEEGTEAPNVTYRAGRAEALPIADDSASAVVAAQALQWFNRPQFYAEAKRALVQAGVLAVAQNNRAWQCSPLLEAYEDLLEAHSPGYSRFYRSFDIEAELNAYEGFGSCETTKVRWERLMTLEGFLEMARSSTKMHAIIDRYGPEAATDMLREFLAEHVGSDQRLAMPYESELFIVRRT